MANRLRMQAAAACAQLAHCYPFDKGRRRLLRVIDSLLPGGNYEIEAQLARSPVRVRCNRQDLLALRLFAFGEDEPHLYRLLRLAISRSSEDVPVFVDAGANLGTLSLRLSQSFGCESICFEPQPALAQLLLANATANAVQEKIRVHEIAVSDRAGEAAFFINASHLGEASLREIGNAQKITVPMRRLDETIAHEVWKRTAIMKVDVEGFEKEVFLGARGLLEMHRPPIVFEVNRLALAERGVEAREVADVLRAAGYTRFYCLERYLFPPANGAYEIANVLAVTPADEELVHAYGFRRDFAAVPRKFLPSKPLAI